MTLVVGRDMGACTCVVLIGEVCMVRGMDIVAHGFNVVLSFGGDILIVAASGCDMMESIYFSIFAVWGIIDVFLLGALCTVVVVSTGLLYASSV